MEFLDPVIEFIDAIGDELAFLIIFLIFFYLARMLISAIEKTLEL